MLAVAMTFAVALAAWAGEVSLGKFWLGLPRFSSYFHDILPRLSASNFVADVGEWYWNWDLWLRLLGETLVVAYVGTALGAIGSLVCCFTASRDIVKSGFVRATARRAFEFCRTVPDLVFVLLFVYALGLGPVPGVLAIAIHTFGALGKQFVEVVDNIDTRPVDGMRSTGADRLQIIRFGVLPQVGAIFASFTLLRFEINVRGASVMGFVGAGGIGKELLSSIRQFYYSDVSAILLMIILTVVLIDLLTEQVRHKWFGVGRT